MNEWTDRAPVALDDGQYGRLLLRHNWDRPGGVTYDPETQVLVIVPGRYKPMVVDKRAVTVMTAPKYVQESDDHGEPYERLAWDGWPRYYVGCEYCRREQDRGSTFFPSHRASARCRSGGRQHCTCDTCF